MATQAQQPAATMPPQSAANDAIEQAGPPPQQLPPAYTAKAAEAQQQQQQHQATVMQGGHNYVAPTPLQSLSSFPAIIHCPRCNNQTMTRIQEKDSGMTYLAGAAMCLLCICAACIPCMAGWCQDVDHYCSQCNFHVAHVPYNGVAQVLAVPAPAPPGTNMAPQQPYGQQKTEQPATQ